MSMPMHWRKVWTAPGTLALLTMTGLLSALLGEAIAWKAIAWTFLAVPVLATLWYTCIKPTFYRTKR